jgi:hypothetical protein
MGESGRVSADYSDKFPGDKVGANSRHPMCRIFQSFALRSRCLQSFETTQTQGCRNKYLARNLVVLCSTLLPPLSMLEERRASTPMWETV